MTSFRWQAGHGCPGARRRNAKLYRFCPTSRLADLALRLSGGPHAPHRRPTDLARLVFVQSQTVAGTEDRDERHAALVATGRSAASIIRGCEGDLPTAFFLFQLRDRHLGAEAEETNDGTVSRGVETRSIKLVDLNRIGVDGVCSQSGPTSAITSRPSSLFFTSDTLPSAVHVTDHVTKPIWQPTASRYLPPFIALSDELSASSTQTKWWIYLSHTRVLANSRRNFLKSPLCMTHLQLSATSFACRNVCRKDVWDK